MKKTVLALLICSTSIASAETNWAGALYYNLKDGKTSAVVLNKLTDFSHVGGRFSLELDGFAGVALSGQVGTAGLALGKSFRLADQVSAFAGAAAAVSDGRPVSFGFIAGLSVRF